jgi:hypothetical protein
MNPAEMHAAKKAGVRTEPGGTPMTTTKKGKTMPISTPRPIIHIAKSGNTLRVKRTIMCHLDASMYVY